MYDNFFAVLKDERAKIIKPLHFLKVSDGYRAYFLDNTYLECSLTISCDKFDSSKYDIVAILKDEKWLIDQRKIFDLCQDKFKTEYAKLAYEDVVAEIFELI